MVIIWTGSLAVLLTQLVRSLYISERIPDNIEDHIKRIGVYYMCIDDLSL